ncbi:MAG TPA: LpqB family beta-propeller domain-containing protein [Streptosporangiaceae bacterium]|jgi:hypothetical protein
MVSKRHALVAVALGVTVALAGCVNVPTGGRVVSGTAPERAPVDDPYVRLIPVPPGRNWSKSQIVQGFLTASAAFDDGHAVARKYLAPKTKWEPTNRPGITVYDRPLTIAELTDRVEVTGRQLGTISTDGQYLAYPDKIDEVFQLAKDAHGQWRITALPNQLLTGMLLGQRDVERAFRTLNLYYFAPDGKVLVPNPIYLPLMNRPELPSQLVRAALGGPTSWLTKAVRSDFPPDTKLLGKGVDVTDGVATVNLSKEAMGGSLSGMSAQLMWTLRQLPEVTRLRLQIDGETMSPPGMGATQSPSDWRHNDADKVPPREAGQSAPVYLSGDDGQFEQLKGDLPQRVDPSGRTRLHRPAISLDEKSVAGLNESGDTVLQGDIGRDAPRPVLHAPDPGGRFIAPTWDRSGTLWMLENYGDRSRLWIKEKNKEPVEVHEWDLSPNHVMALRVARDGVRIAAIAKTGERAQLQMGRILWEFGVPTVAQFLFLGSEIVNAKDLAWRNADELVVLGSTQRQPNVVPYQVPVSGGPLRVIGSGGTDMTSITALPGSPVLVGMRAENADKICRQHDENDPISEWDCFAKGQAPAYPG